MLIKFIMTAVAVIIISHGNLSFEGKLSVQSAEASCIIQLLINCEEEMAEDLFSSLSPVFDNDEDARQAECTRNGMIDVSECEESADGHANVTNTACGAAGGVIAAVPTLKTKLLGGGLAITCVIVSSVVIDYIEENCIEEKILDTHDCIFRNV